MNKRGNEIVEAAIVLPIFILIVLSLIGAMVFQFTAIQNESLVQRQLTDTIREDNSLVKRMSDSTGTTVETGGWYAGALSKDYSAYAYSIDEAKLVRLHGEFLM